MLDELLKYLAPQAMKVQGKSPQPWANGFALHTRDAPYVIRCAGVMGPNPRLTEDAAFDPPAEVLIQHVLGRIQAPEGHDTVAFPMRDDDGQAISNKPDDAWLTLEPGMSFDPANPVCPQCGQPFLL